MEISRERRLQKEQAKHGVDRFIGWSNPDDSGTVGAIASILSGEKERFEALGQQERWDEARLLYKVVVDDYNLR